MTELLSSEDVRSDPELIALVRGGDRDAFGQLYERHVGAANRMARQLVSGSDADDLVSEAFTKVMLLLQAGQGPDVAFRAYLLTAIRRLHVDRVRGEARLTTSDDMTAFDPGVPFQDTAVNQFESGAAARAFASLPERWQLVLWHLEVEGQKPAEIAPLLGMSANSVSALAYRAREGLRQAFLSAHLRETEQETCRWVTENLGSYVRKGLSRRDSTKVDSHLRECRSCTAMYLELAEVNSNLAGVIAPLLLGSLAAGYLAGVPGTSAGGAVVLWGRVKDFAGANSGATAVGAAAATVAAVAIATTMIGGPADEVSDKEPIADAPASRSTSADGSTLPGQRSSGSSGGTAGTAGPTTRTAGPAGPAGAILPGQATPGALETLPSETLFEAPLEEILDVDATDDPTTDSEGSTFQIAAASLDDEALTVTLAGIPDSARDVVVRMTSETGQVWFGQGGPCEVDPRDTARCAVGTAARVGALGNAALSRAVPPTAEGSMQTLRLPIRYPASLQEDTVTVSIRLPGAAQDEVADSLTLTFRPTRSGGPGGGPTTPTSGSTTPTSGSTTPTSGSTTPTSGSTTPTSGSTTPTSGSTTPTSGSTTPTSGSTTPTSGSTTPTSGSTTPDLGQHHPTSGSTTPTSGSTTPTSGSTTPTSGSTTPTSGSTTPTSGSTTPTSGSTTPTSGSTTPTSGSTTPTSGSTTPTSGSTTPTSGSTTPTSGSTTPTSGSTTPTSGSTTPTTTGTDISLSLSVQKGASQVRVTVEGLPVAHDRKTLVIDIATDGLNVPVVPLDRLCSLEDPTRLVCETNGRVEHTDLRLDTTGLGYGQNVVMTFSASLQGEDDPDTSDNSARLSVNGAGAIGIEGQLGFTRVVVEAARAIGSSVSTLPTAPVAVAPTEQPTTLVAKRSDQPGGSLTPNVSPSSPTPSRSSRTAAHTEPTRSRTSTPSMAAPTPAESRAAKVKDSVSRPRAEAPRHAGEGHAVGVDQQGPQPLGIARAAAAGALAHHVERQGARARQSRQGPRRQAHQDQTKPAKPAKAAEPAKGHDAEPHGTKKNAGKKHGATQHEKTRRHGGQGRHGRHGRH